MVLEHQESVFETLGSAKSDDASAKLFSELDLYRPDNLSQSPLVSLVGIEPRVRQQQDSSSTKDDGNSSSSDTSDFFVPAGSNISGEIEAIRRQQYSRMNKDLLIKPPVVDFSNFDIGNDLFYSQPSLQSCFKIMRETGQDGKADYERYKHQRLGVALFLRDEQLNIPRLDAKQYQVLGNIQDGLAVNDFSALLTASRQLRDIGGEESRLVVVRELNEELSGFGLAAKFDKGDLVLSDGTYSLRLGSDGVVAKVAIPDSNRVVEIEPKDALVGLTNHAKFAKLMNDTNGLDLINVHRKR